MTTKKTIKTKKSRIELTIWGIIAVILLAIPVCNVYTKAILSESNIDLEKLKTDIKNQEKVNESLKMEISELASLDKIQVVATENGLSYQNNNIMVVTNE